jgi:conjugal transfer/type IV secretion protein DotA/TraY
MISLNVSRRQVLGYMLTPQVVPRMRTLVGSGFWHLAYFMALVFRAANILPATHPYLARGASGSYGVRNVLSEAANHLVINRKHMDQVILFGAILAGVVILLVQFVLLLIAFLISPASAAGSGGSGMPTNYADFFVTKNPQEDIAFRLLDRVFGVKDLFNSKDADKIGQFHEALHGLFQLYSIGLLIIAVLITLYFVAAVIAETAETGTPFGKRFNHVWAPIRLVVAIGLLIPISQGLNTAQSITLHAAKFGSGFATNGWIKFNDVLGEESTKMIGEKDSLIATLEAPEMMHIVQFMMIVKTCEITQEQKNGRNIQAYFVKNPAESQGTPINDNYQNAVDYFNKGDILIRFGEIHATNYKAYKGYVYPYCGDLVLQTTNLSEPGAVAMQQGYLKLINELWMDQVEGLDLNKHAEQFMKSYANSDRQDGYSPNTETPNYKKDAQKILNDKIVELINSAVEQQKDSKTWKENQEKIAQWGWGGAGAWYNRIAQINGALVAAVQNIPRARMYPAVMEYCRKEKEQTDKYVSTVEQFTCSLADGKEVKFIALGDDDIARTLNEVYKYWQNEGFRNDVFSTHTKMTGNAVIDAINAIFGTKGLFDMCKNTNVHPLAQLSNVGRGIIEASIRNIGFSVASGVAGGLGAFLEPHIGAGLGAASSFFMTIASVGIVIGFVLFYVVPFLPFLYFFFAVGGWIKGLFEAMVGVPLWALAHLRIDGEGLPGDAAASGYFLIFEIFLRPIVIVFGLLASVAIFAAMVKVLNEIFYLVVSNMTGFNPETARTCTANSGGGGAEVGSIEYFRGPVDEFFFTVIYAIIVYMIGMSCFKLIDLIPNNILRWIGAGVATFDDKANEPADGLVQRVAVGGGAVSGQLQGAFGNLTSAIGGAANAASKTANTTTTP